MSDILSYHDLFDLTDEQMMEKTRCASTLKGYKSNISILIRYLTLLERETFLISDQLALMVPDYPYLMKKPIPIEIISRILAESQIKLKVDGAKLLKSASSFKSYCAAIKFWFMKSREFQERMRTDDFLYELMDVVDDELAQKIHLNTDKIETITCPSALTESLSKLSQVKKQVHSKTVKYTNFDSSAKESSTDTKILNLLQQLIEKSSNMESRISASAAFLVADKLQVDNGLEFHKRAMIQEIFAPITAAIKRIEKSLAFTDKFDAPVTVNVQPRFRTFFWGDNYHLFPENFKLPVVSSIVLWRLWLFGDDNVVNTPYRQLDGKHMSKSQRIQLSKARGVMDYFQKSIGKTYAELTAEGLVEAERQFSEHYLALMGGFKRHSNMTFSTVYKHLRATSSSKSNNNPVDPNF